MIIIKIMIIIIQFKTLFMKVLYMYFDFAYILLHYSKNHSMWQLCASICPSFIAQTNMDWKAHGSVSWFVCLIFQ